MIRRASQADAPDLARLVDQAGEGLPSHLWSRMAPEGTDIWAYGAMRAARDSGAFSWRNAWIAEVGGRTAGALVAYDIGVEPMPLDDLPAMFRPLQALENRAPGTRYINVLAVYPDFRRQGIGNGLLATQEDLAGPNGLSIIAADRNEPAIALYRSRGYSEAGRLPIVKEDWPCPSADWVLLTRPKRAV